MDPASAIALASSVIGIVDVLTKSVTSLLHLQTKYKQADLTVSLLIGQLSTLKAALNQISEWITSSLDAVPQHEQLVSDLTISINGCKVLVLALDDRIKSFDRNAAHSLSALGKAQLLWDENGTTIYVNHLSNQISALNLLLTALQCRSLFEQRDLLQSDESRRIVDQVEDDMSSLLGLRDGNSRLSWTSTSTENSQMLDAIFDFDREIFRSKAYQVAMRSNMKQALSSKANTTTQRERHSLGTFTDAFDHVRLDDNEDALTVRAQRERSAETPADTLDHIQLDSNEDAQTIRAEHERFSFWIPENNSDDIQIEDNMDAEKVRSEHSLKLSRPVIFGDELLGETRIKQNVPEINVTRTITQSSQAVHSRLIEKSSLNSDVTDHHAEDSGNLGVRWRAAARKIRIPTKFGDLRASSLMHDGEDVRAVGKKWMARQRLLFLPNVLNLRTSSASAALKRSHKADEQFRVPNEKRKTDANVLLLGTSQSGKSTLLKSMSILIHGHSAFDHSYREDYKTLIFTRLVWAMRIILEEMESSYIPLDDQRTEYHVQTIFMQSLEIDIKDLDPEVAIAIKALWSDRGVQKGFKISKICHISSSYYFDCIDRIASPDYVPTDQDILRFPTRTTGITEVNERNYRIFDVCGRRSERKKWIHIFEDVAVIIFLVDVSDYDQTLLEDQSTSRMQESLTLFESIYNARWFVNTSIVLFFTKIDILKEKVATSPFNHYFPDFSGDPTNLESVKSYIEMRFLSVDEKPDRKIDVHFTSLDPDTSLGETAFATIEKHLHLQEEEKRAINEKSGESG